jgi:DTW domain-containing protein YfiP
MQKEGAHSMLKRRLSHVEDGVPVYMKRQSCARPLAACLCKSLPLHPIDNRWPVHILQHRQERKHALNTARIAMLGLAHCQLHLVTDAAVEDTLPPALLSELDKAWLIYPGSGSLNVAGLDPVTVATRPLILLDANWRKSRRLLLSSAWLQTLPRLSVDLTAPSRYRIRKEPEANYCSTLEAICAVLGTLEQDQQKYAPLLASMDVMIDQQIAQMSVATYRRNYPVDD